MLEGNSSLNSIFDHPKVNVDSRDYERIRESLKYYEGNYPKVIYKNSNGREISRVYSTINMMKKVANQYSTVVFNEQCEISVDGPASDFIKKVIEHNDLKKNFSKYLEPMFALGGLACRPYYDSTSEQIEFSWALANAFYPLRSNTNNISECVIPFKTTTSNGSETIYYTLLEFHEWKRDSNGKSIYIISNELYKSKDSSIIGSRTPLNELYDDLQETVAFNGLSRPLFTYLKPSGFNNINPYSPLGIGVCDNCKDTLDRINKSYDEFDQEIRTGKRRIAVSEMLLNSADENGQVKLFFDNDEDLFQLIPGSNMDDYTIKDLTSDIRTESYISSINHHLKTLEMETSLSSGTFTFDMNGVRSTKTATEVVSENSQTYQTRSMQITEVEKFLKELIISVCELGKALDIYDGDIPENEDIGIDFQDGAFQDKPAQLEYYLRLFSSGLIPGEMILENVLELPEEEAKMVYSEALRQVATRATGIFNSQGLDEEME
ncbi:phage capsid protein [Floricoccus tropicus]|uniref:Phage capsid protein n=1 Tax=Floricoccus tropicus TaxID=1859473 RepID=A0A1E8GKW3_9LACT|nr:phage portal protein [Floricoccus tropicus]OFI48894.1 phage capsid protein [Floricoccus tropicus]